MNFTVYILFNLESSTIYIGYTSNLSTRLKRHNNELPSKITSFTYKHRGKWIVVYSESFSTRNEAMKKEKCFKSGIGREFIKVNLSKWVNEAQR